MCCADCTVLFSTRLKDCVLCRVGVLTVVIEGGGGGWFSNGIPSNDKCSILILVFSIITSSISGVCDVEIHS